MSGATAQQETTVLLQATRPPRAPIRVSLKVALISVRVLLATNMDTSLDEVSLALQ